MRVAKTMRPKRTAITNNFETGAYVKFGELLVINSLRKWGKRFGGNDKCFWRENYSMV